MFLVTDYGILSLQHIVFAGPVDPCPNPEHQGDGHNKDYLIELTLLVGHERCYEKIVFPSKTFRNAAFEELVGLMKQYIAAVYGEGTGDTDGDDA